MQTNNSFFSPNRLVFIGGPDTPTQPEALMNPKDILGSVMPPAPKPPSKRGDAVVGKVESKKDVPQVKAGNVTNKTDPRINVSERTMRLTQGNMLKLINRDDTLRQALIDGKTKVIEAPMQGGASHRYEAKRNAAGNIDFTLVAINS
ncbi:hypothetical protein KJ662_03235 [Patescibacteria group bacterium]|nr:hypothetical protein [Patescibacteria group bacterium]